MISSFRETFANNVAFANSTNNFREGLKHNMNGLMHYNLVILYRDLLNKSHVSKVIQLPRFSEAPCTPWLGRPVAGHGMTGISLQKVWADTGIWLGPQIAGHFKNISSQPKNFVSHDSSLAIMLLTNWKEGVEIPKLIINQSSFVNSTHIYILL